MKNRVKLRDMSEHDLPIFFEQQLDSTANYMAAFTTKKPEDKVAFKAHWEKLLGDQRIIKKTIIFNGHVAGQVLKFELFGEPAVSYWIGREYWGKGVATEALSQFLDCLTIRPLYARVAKDNIASRRVLEKCGFLVDGEDKGFSNSRGLEVEEYVLKLPSRDK